MIKDNINNIRAKIAESCKKCGRDPKEVTLIGVTKYADAAMVKEAVDAGMTDMGENKVQDAKERFVQLDEWGVKVKRHMIGHLQSNKVKPTLQLFDVVQSVDSLDLAKEVSNQAAKLNKDSVAIFVQVKTSDEESKFGITPENAISLIGQISDLPHLKIEGLMTMAPYTEDKELIRNCFRQLRQVKDAAQKEFKNKVNIDLKHLSMGMSDDFDIAIEEGSTMVRVGRAIFK